ncbi:thymidine phosphorylase [Pseudoxanthomonas kalamensis DSM 18571]|uniref:DUF1631 domain-containing protein n=1 Tax=Pseudoxanthomonas kalamensis TaxID=289483 RepID=UPI001390D077|nr:DUF1631 domain-containing protein [Pseudoxanthomonas kalamensis]KAF1711412.1 thymidine phosphorylase [Pseudoxanthomonas kalamensis DSM 18571]
MPTNQPPNRPAPAEIPKPVRKILDAYSTTVSTDLSERINGTLTELEHQLFKLAERAHNNDRQAELMANLHALRLHRSNLLPNMLATLDAQLATIRELPAQPDNVDADPIEYRTLTLVEDATMDLEIALREIVRRHETRAHTPLYLLGQRFGVLAAQPAFSATRIPAGPQSLANALRDSIPVLQLDLESQLLLFRVFEQRGMAEYAGWIDALNELLAEQGVLPGLIYAPQRSRTPQAARPRGSNKAPASAGTHAADGNRPMTGWHGQSSPSAWTPLTSPAGGARPGPASAPSAPAADMTSFATLQQLLSGRRAATAQAGGGVSNAGGGTTGGGAGGTAGGAVSVGGGGTGGSGGGNASDLAGSGGGVAFDGSEGSAADGALAIPTREVLTTLRALQAQPVRMVPGQRHRSLRDVQAGLLQQMREQHGPQATMVQEDADTFELLDLLYNEVEREVRRDAPAVELLVRLQVPMAQAALNDRSFFIRPQHPARELVNSVAESGANWLDEEEVDPILVRKLQDAVDRVVAEYTGEGEEVFEQANRDIQDHMQAQARRAEITERRHVEAARGKDRLEIARRRAAEAIDSALEGKQPQKFVQTLMQQAWADALTLTLLRNGEGSPEWTQVKQVTERIAEAATAEDAAANDPELAPQIETALTQVGYHGDEAAAIAGRLSGSDNDEGLSRTELAAKLKEKTRLGEQVASKPQKLPERTPQEEECYRYLRTLPFGTWFEFVRNQQGDVTRQRLSWFSPITDNALFVNQRGQRIGEQSLDSLARLMARDQARVVTQDKGRLIDRAWQATLRTLKQLAGGGDEA